MFLFDENDIFCLLDLKNDLLTLKTNPMGKYFSMGTSKFAYQVP